MKTGELKVQLKLTNNFQSLKKKKSYSTTKTTDEISYKIHFERMIKFKEAGKYITILRVQFRLYFEIKTFYSNLNTTDAQCENFF